MIQPSGSRPVLTAATVEQLRTRLRGHVVCPTDAQYDEARRIFNAAVDKRPALIVRCAGVADVVTTVKFAREHSLLVAVRGGGHNVAGNAVCDDGLVVDLSQMAGVRVDPLARTARAEGGVTWGMFDRETQAFGLTSTGGIVPTTGIAGLTLGGGWGWLARSYGLASDNLLSADVVTADGDLLVTNRDHYADLFWGLRGGGGNFGIVTSFEFRLHRLGPIVAGLLVFPLDRAHAVLRRYAELTATAPDSLALYAALVRLPDGRRVLGLRVCFSGGAEQGTKVVEALRDLAPMHDSIGPTTYGEVQAGGAVRYPPGQYHYWKGSFLTTLRDAAIEALLAQFAVSPSRHSQLVIEQLGGAISRTTPEETAFAHREAPYSLLILGIGETPEEYEAAAAWVRNAWNAIQRFCPPGVYINYLGAEADEGAERIKAAYGPATHRRLAAVKQQYDPGNFFRLNQNIRPTAS
jgi:FAD binding domain-containing protein/berberine-like enzyme